MHLKSKEIIPQSNNPFEHDLLKREQYANILTQIVKNTEGGFTLSINADWGFGKTTFIKMWEKALQKEGYQTIYFNAWETDFVAEPMMALIDGLRDGFESSTLPQEKLQLSQAVWKAATKLVQLVPQFKVIGEVAEIFQNGINDCLEDKNELQEHQSYKTLIKDFKGQLAKLASSISDDKQLIIFVDELDRCRPDYAVQMLERIKHFFSIDDIVFVISIDKQVMSKSIKAFYGGLDIDTEAYLRRFVDLEFELPEPNIKYFIETQFEQRELGIYFTNYQDYLQKQYHGENRELTIRVALSDCLQASSKSLRDIEKYFNRLSIILSSKELPHTDLDVTSYVMYLYFFHRDIYSHLRHLDLEIKNMWSQIERQISSINVETGSEHHRRYMGMVIGTLAAYIDLKEQRENYRHEILREDPNMEWFPEDYREWLKNEISNHKGVVLSRLFEHIELLKATFNWEKAE